MFIGSFIPSFMVGFVVWLLCRRTAIDSAFFEKVPLLFKGGMIFDQYFLDVIWSPIGFATTELQWDA